MSSSPRSIRFDEGVTARLASFAARHPGRSSSSIAARLVDEGLRMEEHPGILFREGPSGRRATLVGGPDVWQIIAALQSARAAEPELDESALLALVSDNTGVAPQLIRTALDYWAAYPQEVEALIEHNARVAREQEEADRRRRGLLTA
jgi:hypothetical protein